MNERTYKALSLAILFAMLVPMLHAFWKWGAPWFMGISMKEVMPEIHATCKATVGCVSMKYGVSWSDAENRYRAHYEIVARKTMPKDSVAILADTIRTKAKDNTSLMYRTWMQKPFVSIVYE